jgi:Ser-tRNA(Ala) deacylase AlaX
MTKLLLFEDMTLLECESQIISLETVEGQIHLKLDQSVFYPQGGGQPCDTGSITSEGGIFRVESVRWVDGDIVHMGHIESGNIEVGHSIHCLVDGERRALNTRNHSGGHLIDLGLKRIGVSLKPGKGYHFPQGPYVEYEGVIEDPEGFMMQLESACNELIAENRQTRVQLMSRDEAAGLCKEFGIHLVPDGKPMRVVFYGDFGVPCGGTHVNSLSELGTMKILKVKTKKGITKIKYALA